MIADAFTDDHYDVLREIINVAMGQAGAALANLLNAFVELTVPEASIVKTDEVASFVIDSCEQKTEIMAVRQAFFDHINGEAIVIFGQSGFQDLGELLGYDAETLDSHEQEILLDVSNILVGACLNKISEQLSSQAEISYTPPSMLCSRSTIRDLFSHHQIIWNLVLFLKVAFRVESSSFSCDILVFMSEESAANIKKALDVWLEEL